MTEVYLSFTTTSRSQEMRFGLVPQLSSVGCVQVATLHSSYLGGEYVEAES